MEWALSVVLLIAVVAGIWCISLYREKRVQKYTVPFCQAFTELCDHVMAGRDYGNGLRCMGDGKTRTLLPMDEQTDAIQALFSEKPDEYALERFRTMHEMRQEAQMWLSAHTLIADKYNGVLTRCFNLAEALLDGMQDNDSLQNEDRIERVNFVLQKQAKLRDETMPTILPKENSNKS